MIVELKPHEGRCVRTGRPIRIPQDRVIVDGEAVGYVSHKANAKICLVRRFSPWEVAEIEEQVAKLTQSGQRTTSMVPEVPDHILRKQEQDDIDINDTD
jgi:hypothetical protein